MTRLACLIFAFCCLGALTAGDAAPDAAVQAAAQRRAWVWFGLDERAAQKRAAEQKIRLQVVGRDGQDTPSAGIPHETTVQATVQQGVIIAVHVGKPPLQEGTREPALIPLLGLPEADAIARAKALGRAVRVVSRDGEGLPATMDYNETRLNLGIVGGLVASITGG